VNAKRSTADITVYKKGRAELHPSDGVYYSRQLCHPMYTEAGNNFVLLEFETFRRG
jgi:hypothetical protein